jgi:D-sedoheptulose 7-phosphate isomerase
MHDERHELSASIQRSASVISSLAGHLEAIQSICRAVVACLKSGGKVLTAGHGGSAAEALHMAEEFVGRFKADRRPLPAVCLAADPTLLTCIANDYSFAELFPRQVQALGQPGDALVIFSTSGNGDGLRRAAQAARQRQMITIALLGKTGGTLKGQVDHELIVPHDETARIQEAHTLLLHLILESVERAFVP